jgi:homoserine kinase type II
MATFTALSETQVAQFLGDFAVGALVSVAGVPAGSVNSNFEIGVEEKDRYFLRVYEEQGFAGAVAEAKMLARLAALGVPTPAPLARRDGSTVALLADKPAALFPWREGTMRCQQAVRAEDTFRLGAALAQVHVAGAGESRGPGRFRTEDLLLRLEKISRDGAAELAAHVPLLASALERASAKRDPGLPSGLVHGDLFRDNVLFSANGEIAALLDFESAHDGSFAYDVMVTMLAWCVGDAFDGALAGALIRGYESVRPFTAAEKQGFHTEACIAALRFTITRITDYAMRSGGVGARVTKDWRRFAMRHESLQRIGPEGLAALLGI